MHDERAVTGARTGIALFDSRLREKVLVTPEQFAVFFPLWRGLRAMGLTGKHLVEV